MKDKLINIKNNVKENMSDFLTWFSSIFLSVKYGIKNLIIWLPYIWRDRNFDFIFTLELLKKKLELLREQFTDKYSYLENNQYYYNRVNLLISLLDRGYFNTYVNRYDDILEKMYGKEVYGFWIDKMASDIISNFDLSEIEKNGIEKYKNEINELDTLYNAHITRMEKRTEKAKKLFWDILHKDIEKFWN